ncbi:hypothetical protein ACJX0J_005955, partial [Zea mays]
GSTFNLINQLVSIILVVYHVIDIHVFLVSMFNYVAYTFYFMFGTLFLGLRQLDYTLNVNINMYRLNILRRDILVFKVIYASKGSSELAVIYASKGSSELA